MATAGGDVGDVATAHGTVANPSDRLSQRRAAVALCVLTAAVWLALV